MKRILCSLLALASVSACTAEVGVDGEAAGDDLPADDKAGDPVLTSQAIVCAAGATTKGIDVSVFQGNVNWASVKADGVHFAFVRVSDGTTTHDSKFAANWSGAKNAGVIRGAYQFFRPSLDPTAQADLLVSALGGVYHSGDLPPVLDVEVDGGLSPATVGAHIRTWVDRVKSRLGVTPIIYTATFMWRDDLHDPAGFGNDRLWIARYSSQCPDVPSPWTRWSFWQYSDAGHVGGISGAVDLDRFNGTLADLEALAHGTTPAPGAPGTVNTGGDGPLHVRSTPSSSGTVVGQVASGSSVKITCQTHGSTMTGTYGTSDIWDFIGTGYVTDTYVSTGSDSLVAPLCH